MSTTEAAYLDLHRHAPVATLDHEITDRRAWTRETVNGTDWTVTLGDAVVTEILELAATLDHQPLPVLMLSPDQFALAACREAMARVRAILRDGIGVALVDRLPMDDLTREQAIAAYWVLGSSSRRRGAEVGRDDDLRRDGHGPPVRLRRAWLVDQRGAVVPHRQRVRRRAARLRRSSVPMPAREGGISRFCSLYTVHNEMSGATPVSSRASTGRSTTIARPSTPPAIRRSRGCPASTMTPGVSGARFSPGLVRKGYALMETRLDAEAEEALEALLEVMKDRRLWMEFTIERGQLQYLNNREVAHYRSEFKDDETRKRHLIRLWFREQGRPFYDG